MDLNLLSRILQELILDYDRISLPGLGSFIIESVPAYFSEDGNTVFPPNKRVSFKMSETSDDELVIKAYQQERGLSPEDAKEQVEEFLKNLKSELAQKKNVEIPDFGKLRSTKEGNYFFVADRKMGIFAEDMGLEPISIKVLNESPDQVLDISDEVSSIVGDTESLVDNPIKEEELDIDIPVVDVVDVPIPAAPEKKGNKGAVAIISVVAVLVVLIVLFVLFREDIAQLMEGMLYTEEELELIRQSGL